MPPRWNENRFTTKLGIDYPIIQGPLGGLSSQKLTAAVSNFGGLGSFGAHSLTPGAIKDVIGEIRSLTSKPFAMNLWVSMEDEGARTSDENAFNRSLAQLAVHFAALGAPRPTYKPYSPIRFEDQARVLLDANVPVFSFIVGMPPREILEESRTTSRFIPPVRGGFAYGHALARPSDRRHRRCARDRCGRNRRRTGRNRRPGSRRRGRANGHGIPGLRGIRCRCSPSRSFARQKSRTHCVDQGLYRKARAGNSQPLDRGVEQARNRDLALSATTRTCQKPLDSSRGGGSTGSSASVGGAKRQSFAWHRHIGFLALIGRGSFPNRGTDHSVERGPP